VTGDACATGALEAAGAVGSGASAGGGADAAVGVAGIVETVMPGVGDFAVDGDDADDGTGARAAGIGRGGAELDASAFGLAAGAFRGALAAADG
jgi:hypothetical protein